MEHLMPTDLSKTIPFFEAYNSIYGKAIKDTIPGDTASSRDTIANPKDTLQEQDTVIQADTAQERIQVRQSNQIDFDKVDSLFREEELRKQAIQQAEEQQTKVPAPRQAPQKQEPDTITDLYKIFGVTEMPISRRLENHPTNENFLYNIPEVKPHEEARSEEIYKPARSVPEDSARTEVQEIQELPLKQNNQPGLDWITYFLIASFLLIGWTRLFFKKYFLALVKSFHSYNYASTLYYGKNSLTIRASMILNLAYFVTGAIFIFQSASYHDLTFPNPDPFYQFLAASIIFLGWYIWNYLTTGFVGFIFLRQKSFREYLHNYNLYRKILAISLLPIAVILQFIAMEYKPIFILAGGIIFGLIYFVHILRGLQIFIHKEVSIFYLILYLCALEFLPLIILYHVFTRGL